MLHKLHALLLPSWVARLKTSTYLSPQMCYDVTECTRLILLLANTAGQMYSLNFGVPYCDAKWRADGKQMKLYNELMGEKSKTKTKQNKR